MANFIKSIQDKLFEEKEKEPRTEFALLLSKNGIKRFKIEISGLIQNGILQTHFQGNSRFCGCLVFETEEIENDFLIIKQV